MKSEIFARPLTPNDWQMFRDVRLRALRGHPDVFLRSYETEKKLSEMDWKNTLDGKGKCVIGLFDDNQLIGLAAVFPRQGDLGEQYGLMAMDYIDGKYRGRHLSKLLYEARVDWAKNSGFKKLMTSHREGNEASRRANQAFGFRFTDKTLTEWPDGSKAMEYNYELELGRG
ncbi:MAG: GNAT family N-acetyltransferase [Bdellovibrionales bacterium]